MTKITHRDKDIITKSFKLLSRGLPNSNILSELDWSREFNVFSSAIGDNRYVNPLAQSNPNCDPRNGRFMNSYEGGMGAMYKEIYEDNVSLVTITPGVAQFAGLLPFITNMFSPTAAIIANKGRAPSTAFYIGQAAGSIAFWPMQLISVSIQFLGFLTDSPKTSFYTIKPTMGAYSMAANGVLNDLMVKLGWVDPVLPKYKQESHDNLYGKDPDYDNTNAVSSLQALMPDVINKDGTIDLMRLIMKGSRKHRFLLKNLAKLDEDPSITTTEQKENAMKAVIENANFTPDVVIGDPTQDFITKEMGSVSKVRGEEEGNFPEQDSAYLNQDAYSDPTAGSAVGTNSVTSSVEGGEEGGRTFQDVIMDAESVGGYSSLPPENNPNEGGGRAQPGTSKPEQERPSTYVEDNPNDRSWGGDIADLVETAIFGGMDGITWRVEGGGGPTTDTFSNSTAQSPMAGKFNSAVQEANNFKFDVAGGATGIGIVDGLINTFKDGVMGLASGSVIGNLPLALAGNAQIKIPDHWDGSTTQLHRETYTITSHCNYAHPFEQVMKIWVPFALFLPLVAPFSTGGSSHTSPFYVKLFSQSRGIIRTGLVESASFTFGDGEGGWTKDRKPLNLKIEFSVVDLEPLVSVPIDRSISVLDVTNLSGAANKLFDDDSAYNNYLSRLTGLSYLDTILKYSRLNRQLTNARISIATSMSSQNIAAKIMDTPAASLATLFTKSMQR